jgi:3-methyladenine DNA glycosylase AlkC
MKYIKKGGCFMAEALKDIYSEEFLKEFSYKVKAAYSVFDNEKFMTSVLSEEWDELELKGRMRKISRTLGLYLPSKYEEALEILFSIEEDCKGFPYLFFPDFVALYGGFNENWEISMMALERFTTKSSSEFAVRTFIMRDTKKMMNQMLIWSKSDNEHVRRLSSEGCRPRLPWGEALSMFKVDPTPVLAILKNLKQDKSIYVRKSVANNLNDISKDNPMIVAKIAKDWSGNNPYTDWIIRRGCRTLIRENEPGIMELFGYEEVGIRIFVENAYISIDPFEIKIGDECKITYGFLVQKGESNHIRIEYAIDFVKARGNVSRKVFLISDKTVLAGEQISGSKKHNWANLSTRIHYSGEHVVTLLVNGCEVASVNIKLD